MVTRRIVCTEQEPAGRPPQHAHIVAVGTSDGAADRATDRLTLQQVLRAMSSGTVFYTKGLRSGRTARVEKYVCGRCSGTHIRSAPDAVTDNNLDSLRLCRWS